MTSSRRKLWIFTDWDETITSRDTLSLIAPPDGSTGAPPFRSFGEYYMTLMNDFEKKFGPRNTLERQLEFLDQLKVVEKQSVKNVERRGLFKGVTREELCLRAKGVPFREGWKEFVETVQRSEHAKIVAVVSVNWSVVFIECALKHLHGEEFLKQIEIRANVRSVCEGEVDGRILR
jgi:2-hydroxy-3-keto-5-methylthiopentenyl-1-phosphate phosphatase